MSVAEIDDGDLSLPSVFYLENIFDRY